MNQYEKELEVAKAIALEAGKIMLKYFSADQKVEIKDDNSPVTIADKEINSFVIKELDKNFNDLIIGEEESTGEYGMGRRWFCDPIDGTKAYVLSLPTAMFSLALVVDGVPVLGVAYDPFLGLLYEGVKGQGSFCNGIRLKVSEKNLNGGTIAVANSVKRILNEQNFILSLESKGAEIVLFTGVVYKASLLVRGKLVAFHGEGINAHDMAAMHVILEEAGGKVTNLLGDNLDYTKPFLGVMASNGIVHDEIIKSYELL